MHPGLVKGIFFAKGGDYNKDLYPNSLLLEVEAQSNDRKEAERGITLFADVIPTILGAATNNTAGNAGLSTSGAGASGAAKSLPGY